MKKSIIYAVLFLLVILLTYVSNEAYAYSETGHEDFKQIVFVDEECKLLKDYSESEINNAYKNITRKAFGWQTHYLNLEQKIYYDGITIFSRSNKTSTTIDLDYALKETEVTQTSVTVTGSVSTKISGTIKKINTTLTGTISGERETEDSTSYTTDAKTSISLVLLPKTRITMLLTGEAYLTTGVSRYTFFGIGFRKGVWENIVVDTMYYELREEVLE